MINGTVFIIAEEGIEFRLRSLDDYKWRLGDYTLRK